jgi:hypothetical protein
MPLRSVAASQKSKTARRASRTRSRTTTARRASLKLCLRLHHRRPRYSATDGPVATALHSQPAMPLAATRPAPARSALPARSSPTGFPTYPRRPALLRWSGSSAASTCSDRINPACNILARPVWRVFASRSESVFRLEVQISEFLCRGYALLFICIK